LPKPPNRSRAAAVGFAEVDVILQAGTAIAFFRGFGHDRELAQLITTATGSKPLRRTAVVEALRTLSITRPGSRFYFPTSMPAGRCVEQSGFQVAAIRSMGLKRSIDMSKFIDETYRLAREAVRAAPAPTGSISCGNLRSRSHRSRTDTGLAVITSNQAGLWQALRMAG
jgi:maleate cis-trans isomerase